ncbi:unnamed protein product [Rotaria magnacalcarata]
MEGDQTSSSAPASSLEIVSMVIWLSTGNGKFFELHGARDIIKQVLPKSSETAFRWGYYNSPADPDRQSYTQVLEAFLKAGFHIEGSSGAGTQGLLRTQYILLVFSGELYRFSRSVFSLLMLFHHQGVVF